MSRHSYCRSVASCCEAACARAWLSFGFRGRAAVQLFDGGVRKVDDGAPPSSTGESGNRIGKRVRFASFCGQSPERTRTSPGSPETIPARCCPETRKHVRCGASAFSERLDLPYLSGPLQKRVHALKTTFSSTRWLADPISMRTCSGNRSVAATNSVRAEERLTVTTAGGIIQVLPSLDVSSAYDPRSGNNRISPGPACRSTSPGRIPPVPRRGAPACGAGPRRGCRQRTGHARGGQKFQGGNRGWKVKATVDPDDTYGHHLN